MLKRAIVLAILTVVGVYTWDQQRQISQPNGIIVSGEPRQLDMSGSPPQTLKGYSLTPLARFSVEGRVLGHERYYFDRPADLAPIDLALGWGPMSANEVLEKIGVRQGGRFYFWSSLTLPITPREIARYSANMHMIPASESIASELKRVRRGNVVQISGYLVSVEAPDGWSWRSSLSRTDSGEGSCELVYVKHFRIRES
jgi:hypothetical protein